MHAFGDQSIGLIGVHGEQLLADLAGVLAGHRRGPKLGGWNVAVRRRAGLGGHRRVKERMGHVAEHLSEGDLRIGQHVDGPVHRRGGHPRALQHIGDDGLVPARRPLRDRGNEPGAVTRKSVTTQRRGHRLAIGIRPQRYHAPLVVAFARIDRMDRGIVGHSAAAPARAASAT